MSTDALAAPPGLLPAVERAVGHADELFSGEPRERFLDVIAWADGDFELEVVHTIESGDDEVQWRRESVRFKAADGRMVYRLEERPVWRSEPDTLEEEELETWHPPGVEPGSLLHQEVGE